MSTKTSRNFELLRPNHMVRAAEMFVSEMERVISEAMERGAQEVNFPNGSARILQVEPDLFIEVTMQAVSVVQPAEEAG